MYVDLSASASQLNIKKEVSFVSLSVSVDMRSLVTPSSRVLPRFYYGWKVP